jgi:hypothetical protein
MVGNCQERGRIICLLYHNRKWGMSAPSPNSQFAIAGSQAYGAATEAFDVDRYGFYLPFEVLKCSCEPAYWVGTEVAHSKDLLDSEGVPASSKETLE